MHRIVRQVIACLAIAAMLFGVGFSPASAAGQIPFKSSFSGNLAYDGAFSIQLTGSGSASQLGGSTNSSAIAIVGPAACGGFAVNGVETLTAADGEQLTWTVDGDACPVSPGGPVYRIYAPYVITGGTGRFAGATGGGTIECFGDFARNTFAFTTTGTISRPLS